MLIYHGLIKLGWLHFNFQPFKRQPHKMVKDTKTIPRQIARKRK